MLYFYQAFSKEGKKISGYLDANSIQAVRDNLSKQGLFPIDIQSGTQANTKSFLKIFFQSSITLKDKIFFTKQLAILLKSGVPILQSLDMLSEQADGQLRGIVIELRDNIKEGKSLASGLENYPNNFDNIFVQLVKAGEASGKLDIILDRLTDYLEKREAINKKVSSALRTPLINLAMIVVVLIVLLAFLVPEMTDVFIKQKMQLPLSTRILVTLSNLLIHYYFVLIMLLGSIVTTFVLWGRTASGKLTIDKIILKLPIIGYFAKMQAVVQFSRTLGILLEGGVNFAESLGIVVKVVNNSILIQTLNKAKDSIIKQGKITQYLKETNIFPALAIYLINTGEQSGQLDNMLLTVAKTYEVELSEYSDTLAESINPIMMIIMGAVVGFMVLSILTPISQMTDIANLTSQSLT